MSLEDGAERRKTMPILGHREACPSTLLNRWYISFRPEGGEASHCHGWHSKMPVMCGLKSVADTECQRFGIAAANNLQRFGNPPAVKPFGTATAQRSRTLTQRVNIAGRSLID